MGQQFSAGRAGRGRRLWLSSESRALPLGPIPAVPNTPSPSLGPELSGYPVPGQASLTLGTTEQRVCVHHLHSTPRCPASTNTPDITSAPPHRRPSHGGGILHPGPCQGPRHRLPAPQLRLLWVVFPGTSTLLAASPRGREERQGQHSCG